MKTVYSYILMASVGALAACSSYGQDLAQLDEQMKSRPASQYVAVAPSPDGGAVQAIEPAAGNDPAMGAAMFKDQLAREYYTLAMQENNVYDYKAASVYTEKAIKATNGESVMPSRLAEYDLPKAAIPALKEARQSLISALRDSKTPENAAALAKAQASYDCWIEKAEEARDESHVAGCASDFSASIAGLTAPAAGEQSEGALIPASVPAPAAAMPAALSVSFEPNTATMGEGSPSVLDQISTFLTSPEGKDYAVSLTASTSAGVSSPFSERLVQMRVDAVRSALVARGIDPSRFLSTRTDSVAGSGDSSADLQSVDIRLLPPAKGMQPIL